jgi:hypothetical protein
VIRASDALSVAIWPNRTYERLDYGPAGVSWRRACASVLLVAIVLGASTSIAATGVASLPSALSCTICWGFVAIVQLLNGLLLCRSAPNAKARGAQAIELLFLSHLPWSLWLIVAAVTALWIPLTPTVTLALTATALVPVVWTSALVASFCRTILGCSRAEAARRSVLHMAITLVLMLLYVNFAVALWPRLMSSLA